MKERLIHIGMTLTDPDETAGLSTNAAYIDIPIDLTIVAVSVAPLEDDAAATLDINDDGTGVIEAVDASDQNVPGTWATPGYGGTEDPVKVDAGSLLSFDLNNAAVANAFFVSIWALTGEAGA
jgi:hypothetical protein